jgi:hypothetical protein
MKKIALFMAILLTIAIRAVHAQTRADTSAEAGLEAGTTRGEPAEPAEVTAADEDGGRAEPDDRRTFMVPHVLESSGIIAADVDRDGMPDIAAGMRVDGAAVRGWAPEKKEAVRARLEAADEMNDANDFGLFVAMQAIENERVTEITVNEEGLDGKPGAPSVSVSYAARVRLFGLFGIDAPAEALAFADGSADVSFEKAPWYVRYLAVKGDQSYFAGLALSIKTKHDTAMNSIRNLK